MQRIFTTLQKYVLLSVVGVMLMSTAAYAESSITGPYIQYTGNYSYDAETNLLAITDLVFQAPITYSNGDYAWGAFHDSMLGSSFTIGSLYNSDTDNLAFGPTSGEGTGQVSFETMYFSATLDNFVVTQDNATKMEWGAVENISVVENYNSRYIDELGSNNINLWMSLTPDEGYGDQGLDHFNADSVGGVSGQLQVVPVVPEPVSSILFVTGGAALAFRRRISKSKS